MALVKLTESYPNYREDMADVSDIREYEVYDETGDKAGTIHDALLDRGRFRYLVVDGGFWSFGKKVLVPVGHTRIDDRERRVTLRDLTKEQLNRLPKYTDEMTVDYDYEEEVRNVYRPASDATEAVAAEPAYTEETYRYEEHDRRLYGMNEQDHKTLKLYEERLLADKERTKTGEVAVGKRVETETAQVAVPIEKERVVIERTEPTEAEVVTPGAGDFQAGEVARLEVYEESADIQKQAFVREEVSVRKEVERDTVQTEETVRREELEVDIEGNPTIKDPE